ncbi:hypothetical protein TraAM80_05339 [Trypanosoma rangeli]|uniref:Uncharacterized protein n=1 Tax=Trypanosoma rangeli TaxID=5698 RepID=A0A422NF07_TRYRA|nr:uncharacterized protein TraAM80_05339 [Trypanosoma rangeli]RNF04062.1 hypothetical protein TraAM80_05339 [Trypanosoma rangeli]|eukprot:RNF04062.1 hypothetical protein TraAM80_05339 [Trypanosoma rangeli]
MADSPLDGQMVPPAPLPPRPRHTFSLRTVEKLCQRHLESTGTHLRPEQLPAFVEDVRRRLARVEEVLKYRLQCPAASFNGGKGRSPLSRFERVRMSQILADIVLDIAIISILGGNEARDTVSGTGKAVSLSTSHVGVTTPHSCITDEFFEDCKLQWQDSILLSGSVEEALELPEMPPLLISGASGCDSSREMTHSLPLPTCSLAKNCLRGAKQMSPLAERLHYASPRLQGNGFIKVESYGNSTNSKPTQATLSSQEVPSYHHPLSPVSPHFKPVLSMHSADDVSSMFPQPCPRPRKQYDIDLMKVKEFTRCLSRVQELNLTDSEFEMLGLRYAIPGIRELDPSEEQFLAHVGERYKTTGVPSPHSGNGVFVVRHTISAKSTGGNTDAGFYSIATSSSGDSFSLASTSSPSTPGMQLSLQEDVAAPPGSSLHGAVKKHLAWSDVPQGDAVVLSPHTFAAGQCLLLFPGGKDVILKKKDLQLFLALVDARLKSVDQAVDGRLNAFVADLASSSGDEDAPFTA